MEGAELEEFVDDGLGFGFGLGDLLPESGVLGGELLGDPEELAFLDVGFLLLY